jgi:hypothetical protein
MSNNYGPRIVTDGLVLCLDAADRNSYAGSGSTWYDLSGNGHNATLVNSPTFSSTNGGCFTLISGINDYFSVSNSSFESLNTSEVTLEIFSSVADNGAGGTSPFFVFFPNSRSGQSSYLTTGNFTGYWTNESLSWYTGRDYLGFAYTNGHDYFQDSQVRQYVVTLKTNSYKLYVNGTQLTLNSSFRNGSQSTAMITDLFSGGMHIPSNIDQLNGNIYKVSIYNKALTNSEIRQNFEATKGRFGL